MDKRLFNKSSNFFKKEGFYVILFVCLCVVATVAAITARNSKAVKNPPVVEKSGSNVASNSNEGQNTIPNNALQVKNPANISVPNKGASSSAVSKTTDYTFTKPVEGTLARGYTTDLVKCDTIGTYKTNFGIEISAQLNSPVHAVLDGKVETVFNDGTELGQYIIIDHQNGLKTIYANLRDDVKLKAGDKVTKGQVIGYVGKTRANYSEEKFGDHLHFEVMKSSEYVDPAKYVTYSSAKSN
ncbi:MAG: M23 family metallopeptidase [Bacillota bacterium]|nr:M23 family metallopeptidase [Bacillota bacterium]